MKPWEKVDEQLVYDGYRKILRRTFLLPDNRYADFDVVQTSGSVAILALTEDEKIICFRQYRPGPEDTLYEIPGGMIDEGHQSPHALFSAVQRELAEETGYEAEAEYLGAYYRDAYMTGYSYMFVGRNARRTSQPRLDTTEFGELALLSVPDFKTQLFAGLMTDTALGYAGLHHLGLL